MSYKGQIYTPPPTSSWSWFNQGSSVATTIDNNAINLYVPKNASGQSATLYYRTAPSTPYTIIANVTANPINKESSTSFYVPYMFGFTDATKVIAIMPRLQQSATNQLFVDYMATSTSINADLYISGGTAGDYPYASNQWFMIRDDGTNIYLYMSADNQNNGSSWVKIYSEARTTHLTPSKVCFGAGPMGSCSLNVTLNSWLELAV